jgi:hypothetical protein
MTREIHLALVNPCIMGSLTQQALPPFRPTEMAPNPKVTTTWNHRLFPQLSVTLAIK